MTIIKILNNYLENEYVFYGVFVGCVGALGYSFISSYLDKKSVDKGTQTETSENLMDNPSKIIQDNITSIETLSPVSPSSSLIPTTSEVGIQTMAPDVNTVTTVLPTPPINIEVVPNPDTIVSIIDTSNAQQVAIKVDQLNALDPFAAVP
jgi:hypothetical protein